MYVPILTMISNFVLRQDISENLRCSKEVLVLQATLPAMKFRNGKPHYLWLPLKKYRGEIRSKAGEVHLRIQWVSDEIDKAPDQQQASWALEVSLNGVGYSIIEANELNFPREVSFFPIVCWRPNF